MLEPIKQYLTASDFTPHENNADLFLNTHFSHSIHVYLCNVQNKATISGYAPTSPDVYRRVFHVTIDMANLATVEANVKLAMSEITNWVENRES